MRRVLRLAVVTALAAGGLVFSQVSPVAAAAVITAPHRVYGLANNSSIPVLFTGPTLTLGETADISISGAPIGSGVGNDCTPTIDNNWAPGGCSSVTLTATAEHGKLRLPGNVFTDNANPLKRVVKSAAGAIIGTSLDNMGGDSFTFYMYGTQTQLNNTLAVLQWIPDDTSPDAPYEFTGSNGVELVIQAVPGDSSGNAQAVTVQIRMEGTNDPIELLAPTGPFPVVAGADPGYTSTQGDTVNLDNDPPSDWYTQDEDVEQGETGDKVLLVMVATCGEFRLFGAQLGVSDEIEDILTIELGLPELAVDAIMAILPDDVTGTTLGTGAPNDWNVGYAAAGDLEDVQYTISRVEFRSLPATDQTCHLFTFVTDLGNNGMPLSYVYAAPPADFEVPIPTFDIMDTVFVVGQGTPVTATVEQAAGQADPTNVSPIHFTATFSEPVDGFDGSDVTIGGTASASAALVTGGPEVFDIEVSGMTSSGTVTASLPADAAQSIDADTSSDASTSLDNVVTFQEPDGISPTVSIDQTSSQLDPTSSSPISFTAIFSEPVTGFTGSDIDFTGSTATGTLVGTVSGGPETFNVAVAGMTSSGLVTVGIPAAAATDQTIEQNASTASTTDDDTVEYVLPAGDVTPPTVTIDQAGAQADPTDASPINFTVVFSEDVTGFDSPADVTFTGSTAGGTLVADITGGPSTYNVAVSGMTTSGTVVASVPANVAADLSLNANPNPASTSTDNTVTFNAPIVDTTDPTVTINQAAGQADPTSASPILFDIVFSEPVTGLDDGDIVLTGTAGATTANVTGSGTTYTATVTGMTTTGTVIANIAAGAAQDAAANANTPATSADNTVTFNLPPVDTTDPTVTINQAAGQADPTSTTPINFTVVFSEPVTGFESAADVDLSASTAGGTHLPIISGGPTTYNVAVLVAPMATTGTIIASIPAGAAQDAAVNTSVTSTSADNTVLYIAPVIGDTTEPTVTINQAAGQGDPTSTSPINFTVVFSEPVTGFNSATDINLSASTVGGPLVPTITGGPITYNVAVAGMTLTGDVIASIPPDVADDDSPAGNPNQASSSVDNTVTYNAPIVDTTDPTVTINQGAAQADPTSATPIVFDIVFSEPVTGLTDSDIQLFGTAGATTAVVAGSGTTYTATVSGMTTTGTVIATISPAAAHDTVSNPNTASTSTDNTVTYNVPVADTPLTITTPANMTVPNDPGLAGAIVNYLPATASGGEAPIVVVCLAASGTFFALGTTTVTCIATDSELDGTNVELAAAAVATGTFTITVVDTEPPVIADGPDLSVTTNGTTAVVVFGKPAASDNAGSPTVTCVLPSGTAFALGVTTVTCTATDGAGLTASSSFTVTVNTRLQLPATGHSNHSLVIAMSLVLFGALLLLAAQINPFRRGSAAVRRRRTTSDQ